MSKSRKNLREAVGREHSGPGPVPVDDHKNPPVHSASSSAIMLVRQLRLKINDLGNVVQQAATMVDIIEVGCGLLYPGQEAGKLGPAATVKASSDVVAMLVGLRTAEHWLVIRAATVSEIVGKLAKVMGVEDVVGARLERSFGDTFDLPVPEDIAGDARNEMRELETVLAAMMRECTGGEKAKPS